MSELNTTHLRTTDLIKRIYKDYVSKHLSTIIYALLMMIISAGATGLHAWLVQPALDNVLINSDKNMLIIIPIAIILTTLAKGIATYIHTIKMNAIAHLVISKLQLAMFEKLMFIDMSTISGLLRKMTLNSYLMI